jgi:hypothetical protein
MFHSIILAYSSLPSYIPQYYFHKVLPKSQANKLIQIRSAVRMSTGEHVGQTICRSYSDIASACCAVDSKQQILHEQQHCYFRAAVGRYITNIIYTKVAETVQEYLISFRLSLTKTVHFRTTSQLQ